MASPIEIKENLPDTLPADFGEWDSQDSSVAVPVETPAKQEPVRRESPQRESARREAEALDLANRHNGAREVSREFEPARNVTPFPEPEVAPSTPRGGIPAPVIRAPRNSPAASATAATPVSGDPAYQRLMRSVETVVDKLPPVGTPMPEPKGSTIDLVERKPDRPLFSSAAVADETSGATLLNDLLEDEEERKTRRKWIMSGCVFGVALLLVSFQLFHYFGSSGKLKHIVPASQPVTAATSTAESDVDAVSIPDARQTSTDKPSAAKAAGNLETSSLDGGADSSQAAEAPAPAVKRPGASQTQMMQTQLSAPTRLPQSVRAMATDAPPPALGGANIAALNGGSAVGNVFSGKSDPRVSGPKPIMVSAGVASGMLIRKTQPVYPSIARSARVQGTVTLTATITSTGKVANIRVVSGPPMLRQSAIDAVKTWVYKPYALNGYPTDVETTVNLVFSLGS
jgi:protein TonB